MLTVGQIEDFIERYGPAGANIIDSETVVTNFEYDNLKLFVSVSDRPPTIRIEGVED